MSYELILKDSQDEQHFSLLDIPIIRKDIEGASDTTTLDGNIYTDYLYLKTQYEQSFSWLFSDDYEKLRGFYTRQFESGEYPTYTLLDHINTIPTTLVDNQPVRLKITDGGIIDSCGTRQNVKLVMRETEEQ